MLESVKTGIVAGGANVVGFTTGRGPAFGCTPVPSIKVATNSALYDHLNDDMDINAGYILDGESSSPWHIGTVM